MAPIRATPIPEGDASLTSPFLANTTNLASLKRRTKQGQTNTPTTKLCCIHSDVNRHQQEAWALHHEILTTLIRPLLTIYTHTKTIAKRTNGPRDLEFAFSGEARDAFVWLHSFFTLESARGYDTAASGCAACFIDYVLETEPTVRLVLSGCKMLQSLRHASETPKRIPNLDFFIGDLKKAVEKDDWFGKNFWSEVQAKAESLVAGVFEMGVQCMEMEGGGENEGSDREAASEGKPVRLGRYKMVGKKTMFVSGASRWLEGIVVERLSATQK